MSAPDVLVADPPWKFGDSLPGPKRGASKHYTCMTTPELMCFELPPIGKNAVLFLWRVAAMQNEALHVVRSWGFKVKSELVWLKTTASGKRAFGMGHYTRASHEVCLICVRGSALPAVRNVRSVFEAPLGVHSEKPAAFYRLVETMYPESVKHELFARTVRPSWNQYGLELGKLGQEAV